MGTARLDWVEVDYEEIQVLKITDSDFPPEHVFPIEISPLIGLPDETGERMISEIEAKQDAAIVIGHEVNNELRIAAFTKFGNAVLLTAYDEQTRYWFLTNRDGYEDLLRLTFEDYQWGLFCVEEERREKIIELL